MGQILDRLAKERIFDLEKRGDTFFLTEGCGSYFQMKLTSAEIIELAAELTALAKSRKRYPPIPGERE